jgi:hypothetical protein
MSMTRSAGLGRAAAFVWGGPRGAVRAGAASCPAAPAVVPDSPAPTKPAGGAPVPAPSLSGAWPSLAGLPPRCPAVPLVGAHATYNIGPGQKYPDLTSFPWLSLKAGDVVNIYYAPTPYATKFALRAAGTAAKPVIINGVADAQGRLPTITGEDAATAKDAIKQGYFATSGGSIIETYGVIVMFRGADDAYGYKASHVTIQNLRVTGGGNGNSFTDHTGKTQPYANFAAGLYVVAAQFLTIQNDEIFGNGLGVFVNNQNDVAGSSFSTTVPGNYNHDNGVVNDYLEHNLYVQGVRSLYEGNYIGQLIAGAPGGSLKDRSSGPVVRYNTIVSSARAIDLVDSENGSTITNSDPLYNYGWVYGNLIIDDFSLPDTGSGDLIHWGGDSTNYDEYHNGPLYFYDNTIVVKATQAQAYSLALFDMPTAKQTIVLANNVIAHTGTSMLYPCANSLDDGTVGTLSFTGTNWFAPYVNNGKCKLDKSGGSFLAGKPALTAGYRLPTGSPAIGRGLAYPSGVTLPSPASVANLKVTQQYTLIPNANTVEPSFAARATVTDLGAFPYP